MESLNSELKHNWIFPIMAEGEINFSMKAQIKFFKYFACVQSEPGWLR